MRIASKYSERVFISGKVSGLVYQDACRLFYDASAAVLAQALCPVVPVDLCRAHWGWYKCMVVCLWYLLCCKYILQLDNWTDSRGAKWEYRAAKLLRKKFLKIENGKIVGL